MQRAQYNFAVLIVALLAAPALAGTTHAPHKPDPLLDGGPTAPCAASPDYAEGTDVNGRRVVPADVAAAPVPMPDNIAVPRGKAGARGRPGRGDSAYVSLDGRRLAPLLNQPPCRNPGR